MQRFGLVLRTTRGVSACECAEALGKASASPFQSVRKKILGQLFQKFNNVPYFFLTFLLFCSDSY